VTCEAPGPSAGDPSEEVVVRGNRPSTGLVLRRFTLGSGLLKRGSDRLELLTRVLLVCCLLAAVPISVAAGTAAHEQARRQVAADAVDRHRVPARLVGEAATPVGELWDGRLREQWTAEWSGPDGTDHRGTVTVPAGAEAGSTVPVWIDGDGDRTPPPMRADDVTSRAIGQGLGVFVGLSVLACGAQIVVRTLLDRSRSRRWGAEWASVGPMWTRSVS
jgi:hypothetical protein